MTSYLVGVLYLDHIALFSSCKEIHAFVPITLKIRGVEQTKQAGVPDCKSPRAGHARPDTHRGEAM